MILIAAEKNFENKIKAFFKEKEIWYVKYFANRMTKVGIPDILANVNGYFVAVEVKASNGKPSELQKYNVNKINKSNGFAVILYPEQFETFKTLILSLIFNDKERARELTNEINARWLNAS